MSTPEEDMFVFLRIRVSMWVLTLSQISTMGPPSCWWAASSRRA
nr:hypothetical protein [Nonomuraea turkmeniaca]